jgi:hypothetical protein
MAGEHPRLQGTPQGESTSGSQEKQQIIYILIITATGDRILDGQNDEERLTFLIKIIKRKK